MPSDGIPVVPKFGEVCHQCLVHFFEPFCRGNLRAIGFADVKNINDLIHIGSDSRQFDRKIQTKQSEGKRVEQPWKVRGKDINDRMVF